MISSLSRRGSQGTVGVTGTYLLGRLAFTRDSIPECIFTKSNSTAEAITMNRQFFIYRSWFQTLLMFDLSCLAYGDCLVWCTCARVNDVYNSTIMGPLLDTTSGTLLNQRYHPVSSDGY